jgi:predicted transcriptional regulator
MTGRRTESITIQVDADVLAALDALAKRQKVDRAVLVRHLLSEAMRTRARQGRP